jgi:hypothetical protein
MWLFLLVVIVVSALILVASGVWVGIVLVAETLATNAHVRRQSSVQADKQFGE